MRRKVTTSPLRTGLPIWAVGLICALVGSASTPRAAAPGVAEGQGMELRPLYRFQLTLAAEDQAQLRTHSRHFVPVRLRIDGVNQGQAAIHLKGHGSFRPLEDKPSFTLDFARSDPPPPFHGLRKIHLNNSVEDPSYLREWIGSELFRTAGVPAPAVTHALVELNGRSLGLYVLKEAFADEFLARNFTAATGEWYDLTGGEYVSEAAVREGRLGRLVAAAQERDPHTRWQQLQSLLDVERFASFMAMEVLTCHWDGYSLARNNFRVYNDPGTGKLVFLPTGMDQLFGNPALTWRPQMAGLVARSLMEIPQGRDLYEARFRQLLSQSLKPGVIQDGIRQQLLLLRPALSASVFNKLREEAARLSEQIAQRHDFLVTELRQPIPALLPLPPGGALLTKWHPADGPAQGHMRVESAPDQRRALHTVAGPVACASWRTKVRLASGRYQLQAMVRVRNVAPLSFGKEQGAGLRVRGASRQSPGLLGTSGWQRVQTCFEVTEPEAEVELICDLRASAGEAWFAKDSLLLKTTNDRRQICSAANGGLYEKK
jgi:spore coat protein H